MCGFVLIGRVRTSPTLVWEISLCVRMYVHACICIHACVWFTNCFYPWSNPTFEIFSGHILHIHELHCIFGCQTTDRWQTLHAHACPTCTSFSISVHRSRTAHSLLYNLESRPYVPRFYLATWIWAYSTAELFDHLACFGTVFTEIS